MTEYRPTQTPDNPKLADSTLLNHAWEFAAAADAFARADKLRSWMPLFFLFGRSIELAIKAYAIHSGATEKDVRKIGHDLEKGLEFVEERGFVLSPPFDDQERNSVLLLNDHYSEKLLEYPLMQGYMVPQPRIMRGVVDRVIAAAFIAIWGVDRYHYDRARSRALGLTIPSDVFYGEPSPRGYEPIARD
jgi:hypothetical protein